MANETEALDLMGPEVADGCDLSPALQTVLLPGQQVEDEEGRKKTLPRFFLRIDSAEQASTALTPHFRLSELIRSDLKEHETLRQDPRYVPCAVRILAAYLERFRELCGARSTSRSTGATAVPSIRRTGR